MLWLALATVLLSDPSPLASSMGPMTPLSAPTSTDRLTRNALLAPVIPPAPEPACPSGFQQATGRLQNPAAPVGDGRVRLYRLFALNDARGCPIPVIVRDAPEADRAIGREVR